jgi:transcriptional regulator with XRE-family HTH domain
MRGDPELGAVLRQFRTSRRLSQEQVAARAPCAPSMVSQVETGRRVLHAELAVRLDQVYGTGTTITGMVNERAYPGPGARATLDGGGVLVRVELPHGGGTMLVPRRAVLAALSIGTTASALPDLHHALAKVPADEELLAEITQTLSALHAAGRVTSPAGLIDSLIGQVTVLDVVRRRVPVHLRRDYVMLAAQYAENLSFMVQESGDVHGAGAWLDRTQVWAGQARWPDMVAYAHVRRSALAGTCAGDGLAAVEHAANALRVPNSSARVRGLAAASVGYGHALLGRPDATKRALGEMMDLFAITSNRDESAHPGLIATQDMHDPDMASYLLSQVRATCDVRLGGGGSAIRSLTSVRVGTSPDTRRNAVNEARLARAYAQVGDPERACTLALGALDTGQALDSLATRVELRRVLGPLGRWPERSDVAEVRHRITALA